MIVLCPYPCSNISPSTARSAMSFGRAWGRWGGGPASARRPGRPASAAAAWGTSGCRATPAMTRPGGPRSTNRRMTPRVAETSQGLNVGRLSITQTQLPGPDAALLGVAAFVVVNAKSIWSLAKHFHVMAHEGMHATTGTILGLPVRGITLKRNGDGVTEFRVPVVGGAGFVTGLVGYWGPSAFGPRGASFSPRERYRAPHPDRRDRGGGPRARGWGARDGAVQRSVS